MNEARHEPTEPTPRRLHVCTIAAKNYLPFVHVLGASFLANNPGARFTALVVDGTRDEPELTRLPFEAVTPAVLDLAEDDFHRMAYAYDVTELSTALKPWMLRWLLEQGAEVAVYLDPDIQVFASMDEIACLADQHGVVLTPHTLTPIPRDGLLPSEADIKGSGVFNLGFIAVTRARTDLLLWWEERLRRESISDPPNTLFTDQRWIDLVPSYFSPWVHRDPGCNVAYWNLYERPLAMRDGQVLAGGSPLVFFHFSGYRPDRPWVLSKYVARNPRSTLAPDPVLRSLCSDYGRAATAAGYESERSVPYGWNVLPDGTPIRGEERRAYWRALVASDRGEDLVPPDPFGDDGPESLAAWLAGGAPGAPPGCIVTREQHQLWEGRPDLVAVFPRPLDIDENAFLSWLASEGRLTPDQHAAREARDARHRSSLPGVNICGYLTAELGVGKLGRQVLASARLAGLPHSTFTSSLTLSRQEHPEAGTSGEGRHHPVNVVAVNADTLPLFRRQLGEEYFRDTYTIGLWAWELDEFPDTYHGAFDLVDEVWAISDFVRDAIAACTTKPVLTFPLPVEDPGLRNPERASLGLPDGYLFLFTFDYLSVADRKNPFAVVEAFTRAFSPGEGPVLVVKGINGHLRAEDRERLRFLAADRPDVHLLEDYLDADRTLDLLAACDVFVSLHRSEGYGLAVAEAMSLGKPVVTTAYSGVVDFTTPDTAHLIPYTLVPVPPGAEPYPPTARWAEPDLDAAAKALRTCWEAPERASELGARARSHILRTCTPQRSAGFLAARVENAVQVLASRAVPEGVNDPMNDALRDTAEALQRTRPAATTRTRRAWNRALDRMLRGRDLPLEGSLGSLHATDKQLASRLVEVVEAQAATTETLESQRAGLNQERVAREKVARALEATEVRIKRDLAANQQQFTAHQQELAAHQQELAALREGLAAVADQVASLVPQIATAVATTAAHTQHLQDASAHLKQADEAAVAQRVRLDRIDQELAAIPYRTSDALERAVDFLGRTTLGFEPGTGSLSYREFEVIFRGTSEQVADRLRPYAPLMLGSSPVLDLGAGRGELLKVLDEHAVTCSGVDLDRSMVEAAQAEGLDVRLGDALEALRALPDASLGAVTSFQFVEHLDPALLAPLFAESRRVLRPGGLLIAETVNPYSPAALKAFWLDLTHVRPLYPESLLLLASEAGFSSATVTFVHGGEDLAENLRGCGEYALVATAPL